MAAPMGIVEATAFRLDAYDAGFRPDVIDHVSETAGAIAVHDTYQEFFAAVGLPAVEAYKPDGYKHSTKILDHLPEGADPTEAILVHLPMANGDDPNMLYQLAYTIADNPKTRIVAAFNDAHPGHKSGALDREQRKSVGKGVATEVDGKQVLIHDLSSAVDPLLKYLDAEAVLRVRQSEFSLGTYLGAEAAARGAFTVTHSVSIEPVIGERTLPQLGADFIKTGGPLEGYVEANGLPTFEQARKAAPGLGRYVLGLMRPTNVAIARALAAGDFERRQALALEAQPGMINTIAWGGNSELAVNKRTGTDAGDVVVRLQSRFGKRVSGLLVPGAYHNAPNDLALQNAINRQAFTEPAAA